MVDKIINIPSSLSEVRDKKYILRYNQSEFINFESDRNESFAKFIYFPVKWLNYSMAQLINYSFCCIIFCNNFEKLF